MATIKRTFVKTKVVKIISCSFPFMWYKNQIGMLFEIIEMKKKNTFVPLDIETYAGRTVKPPFAHKPDLEGWILVDDYEVISESTKEIANN